MNLSYFSKKKQNDHQYKERESCGRHRAGNSQKPSTAEINEIRLNQLPTVELKKTQPNNKPTVFTLWTQAEAGSPSDWLGLYDSSLGFFTIK